MRCLARPQSVHSTYRYALFFNNCTYPRPLDGFYRRLQLCVFNFIVDLDIFGPFGILGHVAGQYSVLLAGRRSCAYCVRHCCECAYTRAMAHTRIDLLLQYCVCGGAFGRGE